MTELHWNHTLVQLGYLVMKSSNAEIDIQAYQAVSDVTSIYLNEKTIKMQASIISTSTRPTSKIYLSTSPRIAEKREQSKKNYSIINALSTHLAG